MKLQISIGIYPEGYKTVRKILHRFSSSLRKKYITGKSKPHWETGRIEEKNSKGQIRSL